jgi:hypothetical protein
MVTPCRKCGFPHLPEASCIKKVVNTPEIVVNTEPVVNPPVEEVANEVVNKPLLDVVNTHSNVVNKPKDRHRKTEARAKYMREYMRKRRAAGV